jgi:hypothetical protein
MCRSARPRRKLLGGLRRQEGVTTWPAPYCAAR